MIFDALKNIERYASLHHNFQKAFSYLTSTDLSSLEIGKHKINGEAIIAVVMHEEQKGKDNVTLEGHRRYIDLHLTIEGEDILGWKNAAECEMEGKFDEENDYVFFKDRPTTWFAVPENHVAIFFPDNAHAAMAGAGRIKKLVLKIEVE